MTKFKTIGELKKALEDIPDDFIINMNITRELTAEELANMPYGYPFDSIDSQLELIDIGYSDKVVKFNAEI